MTTPATLGKRIAQARRELGVREQRDVTQLDLAQAVGTTSASLSEWESDKKVPREESLLRLAKVLGVTPAYLRYGYGRAATEVSESIIDPERDRKLTDADRVRAVATVQASKKPAAKKKPRRA